MRASVALALVCLGLAACSTGEGQGSVQSDRLFVKDCWDGPFDLQPDFFGTIPFEDTQQIRVQRGDRSIEVSDGVILLVNDVAKIRQSQLGVPIALGLPVGVKPPGFPPRVEIVPAQVSLSLYLYATCHLQNGGLNSVSGTITFTHLFSGDRNENNADERLTEAHFDALVADPRDAKLLPQSPSPSMDGGASTEGGLPEAGAPSPPPAGDGSTLVTYGGSVTVDYGADQTSHVIGDISFYFQRGVPAQPFPVKTVVDRKLQEEAAKFDLRYTCTHCAHFDEVRRACAEGYPNGPHLDERTLSSEALEFCKSFELA